MKNNRMPALFIGHGSPMNAIEDNVFTQNWENSAKKIGRPQAILSVSAHWYVRGSRVNDDIAPKTIYDMYGFPDELYEVEYNAPGAPALAKKTAALISAGAKIDNSWGLDHGTWSVLRRMYPEADIPVYQLSVNSDLSAAEHFHIGEEISALRDEGILILGSGNVVHNLRMLDWDMRGGGYPWAEKFDDYIKQNILARRFENVVDCSGFGDDWRYAVPMPDHFSPLLYVLGALGDDDEITVFNDACMMGGLSMTCYLLR